MLRRRDFALLTAATAVAAALPGMSQAQGGPVEGRQYLRLPEAQPTTPGKIEVIEFFWFGCPHCFAFDPGLEEWLKRLLPDVSFRRVPVGAAAMQRTHQKMFYALEAMGVEAKVHARIFNAIHVEHQDISEEAGVMSMIAKLGVDMTKFKAAFSSFGVQSRVVQANKLAEAYRIESIPTMAVGGLFLTSPGMAGNPSQNEIARGQAALAVTDALIRQVRSVNKG